MKLSIDILKLSREQLGKLLNVINRTTDANVLLDNTLSTKVRIALECAPTAIRECVQAELESWASCKNALTANEEKELQEICPEAFQHPVPEQRH
jgi:hypothetical protein